MPNCLSMACGMRSLGNCMRRGCSSERHRLRVVPFVVCVTRNRCTVSAVGTSICRHASKCCKRGRGRAVQEVLLAGFGFGALNRASIRHPIMARCRAIVSIVSMTESCVSGKTVRSRNFNRLIACRVAQYSSVTTLSESHIGMGLPPFTTGRKPVRTCGVYRPAGRLKVALTSALLGVKCAS